MKVFQGVAVLAATVSAINFEPPQVQSFVSSALIRYSEYVHYTPAPAVSTPAPGPAKVKVNVATTHAAVAATSSCAFWMGQIKHQGVAAFNPDPSNYKVFRNVKDYGAKGDGKTDDTAAIQRAVSSGGRCAPGSCGSSTVTPAVVFFPPGTYVVSSSIVIDYYTQLIGNPNCLPVIKPTSKWTPGTGNVGIFEGDPYGSNGLKFGATNVFWRQIRNFVLDMTDIPAANAVTGIHWPTGQATSIQNVVFKMSKALGTLHQGVFIESGSGGYIADLTIEGGSKGLNIGSQQFTLRNIKISDAITAINQLYSWSWLYQNINVDNCSVALDMSTGGSSGQSVGSITLIDSTISNTLVGIKTAYTSKSQPLAAGTLIVENVDFTSVRVAIDGPKDAILEGVSHVSAFGQGHKYTPSGPQRFQGSITPNSRPASLLQADGKYYERSKPQYDRLPVSSFISARSQGATGNGKTDDTKALQKAINLAVSQGKVLFVDHGDYLVTSTIYVPAGAKIVGESYSVILSSGKFFNDMSNPKPVVQIGKSGEKGSIEWSDMIVSGQGPQQGAILIQYNLVAPAGTPSGLWDVHTRVGGFAGSQLQVSQCPVTANKVVTTSNLNKNCIAAYLNLHISKASAGLYLENVWLWTADHDVEDPNETQITLYSGRGLLDESTSGPVWMVGTAVEHNVKYQYQFTNTRNVFAGFIQTETAYYQPNPPAPGPFPYSTTYSDPQFPTKKSVTIGGKQVPASDGWGLRIADSSSVFIYGAGHYSFFNNNNVTCSNQGNGAICQSDIVSVEGKNSDVSIYNLATVGAHYQVTQDGKESALFSDNFNNFTAVIARFTL